MTRPATLDYVLRKEYYVMFERRVHALTLQSTSSYVDGCGSHNYINIKSNQLNKTKFKQMAMQIQLLNALNVVGEEAANGGYPTINHGHTQTVTAEKLNTIAIGISMPVVEGVMNDLGIAAELATSVRAALLTGFCLNGTSPQLRQHPFMFGLGTGITYSALPFLTAFDARGMHYRRVARGWRQEAGTICASKGLQLTDMDFMEKNDFGPVDQLKFGANRDSRLPGTALQVAAAGGPPVVAGQAQQPGDLWE